MDGIKKENLSVGEGASLHEEESAGELVGAGGEEDRADPHVVAGIEVDPSLSQHCQDLRPAPCTSIMHPVPPLPVAHRVPTHCPEVLQALQVPLVRRPEKGLRLTHPPRIAGQERKRMRVRVRKDRDVRRSSGVCGVCVWVRDWEKREGGSRGTHTQSSLSVSLFPENRRNWKEVKDWEAKFSASKC